MSDIPAGAVAGPPLTGLALLRRRLGYWGYRLRRKLPYLVWPGDELDVRVTFARERLQPDGTIDQAFAALRGSALAMVESELSHMGIGFDRGVGWEGRDWEWDWSLKGPISVKFVGPAKKPERRMDRPKPKLAARDGVTI